MEARAFRENSDDLMLILIRGQDYFVVWDTSELEADIMDQFKIENEEIIFVTEHWWPSDDCPRKSSLPTSNYPPSLMKIVKDLYKMLAGELEEIPIKQLLTHHAEVMRKIVKKLIKEN